MPCTPACWFLLAMRTSALSPESASRSRNADHLYRLLLGSNCCHPKRFGELNRREETEPERQNAEQSRSCMVQPRALGQYLGYSAAALCHSATAPCKLRQRKR